MFRLTLIRSLDIDNQSDIQSDNPGDKHLSR